MRVDQSQPGDDDRVQLDRLQARVERLRAVAEAADRASLEIDQVIQGLEPKVNNMQEAATALSALVHLTGSVQRTLVGALNQLAPGDREPPVSQEPADPPPA
jgi:ABC-type transporter Mla subunit MlaD